MRSDKSVHGIKRLIAIVMLTAMAGGAVAGEENELRMHPHIEPVLEIDSGNHTGLATVMSVDSQEKYFVTASEDKTLRLWRLEDGHLLHTYRMPIGSEHQGKLYATAISPDGHYIAAGGYLGDDKGFGFVVYIIDRKTGHITKRINKLGNIVNHLVFSKDGHYLAGLLGQGGLKVWNVNEGFVEVASDDAYNENTYWAAFSPNGELVTTSEDGYVRLYNASFQLKKKVLITKGSTPVAADFSPDGKKLVVGFLQAHSIVVLSAEDLSVQFRPDVSGIAKGDISVVKWGKDGTIIAGGMYAKTGRLQIRRWNRGGHGNYQDIPVGNAMIMDLNILSDGRILCLDSEPSVTLLTNNGTMFYKLASGAALHQIVGGELYISPDGFTVALATWGEGSINGKLRFDAKNLQLTQYDGKLGGLRLPKTHSDRLKVQRWHGSSKPMVNGTLITLGFSEFSNVMAMSPDNDFFVLGTNRGLRMYTPNGTNIWANDLGKSIRSVNLSDDGKIVVAVLSDHTIRWFNAGNGEEILAVFIHADKKRWVAWTPEGYFSHSPKGGGLAGYRVTSDKNHLASFVSFSDLDKQMMSPGKLRAKISGVRFDNVSNELHRLIFGIVKKYRNASKASG